MSDQSTESSEEAGSSINQAKQLREVPSRLDVAIWMFFVYLLLVWILITLVDIHATLNDQRDQDAQAYNDQYDLVYEQVEILYETQRILCDALNGTNYVEGDTNPTPTPTSTTIPTPIPGSQSPVVVAGAIEEYC